jgi:AraC-type transcriptional regulator
MKSIPQRQLSVVWELCGAHWPPERVFLSSAKPTDVGLYRRFFGAPCRFGSLRSALAFSALLGRRLAGADPEQLRILQAQAHARDDLGVAFRLPRTLRTLLLAHAASANDEGSRLLSMPMIIWKVTEFL